MMLSNSVIVAPASSSPAVARRADLSMSINPCKWTGYISTSPPGSTATTGTEIGTSNTSESRRQLMLSNLDQKRVRRGSYKGLDPQILFDGLEKDLYLPPVLVYRGNRRWSKIHVIGQKYDDFFIFLIPDLYPSQVTRILLMWVESFRFNDLITQDVPMLWNGLVLQNPVTSVVFPGEWQRKRRLWSISKRDRNQCILCLSPQSNREERSSSGQPSPREPFLLSYGQIRASNHHGPEAFGVLPPRCRNLAQSKRLAQSSITVASRLKSLFLNRNRHLPRSW